jgi:hypothetical protein
MKEWERGRWGDGVMGRWGDGEMGRWGDLIRVNPYNSCSILFSFVGCLAYIIFWFRGFDSRLSQKPEIIRFLSLCNYVSSLCLSV